MSQYQFRENAFSDQVITATPVMFTLDQEYLFKRLEYPDLYIPNRTLAHHLSFQDDQSEEVRMIRKEVDEYNAYLAKLEAIPGFIDIFIRRGCCISREDVSKYFSADIADYIFSLKSYCFYTDLCITDDNIFDQSVPVHYQAYIGKESVIIPLGESDKAYSDMIWGRKAIWNWVSNGHDFCYYLWDLLGARDYQSENNQEMADAVQYYFEAYEQIRFDNVEPQLTNVFRKLESLGYLESFTIKPDDKDPRWKLFGKQDGTIDLALVDMSFVKNRLLMEQIELLLWQRTEDIKEGQCFLTDNTGKQYISDHQGRIGAHNKLKIYGKLDCSSAARYIAKGQYIRHRLFFDNEETAIAAGYRPCAVCMPEAYTKWNNLKK